MSRPSSPIQPTDAAARPRWEHSPTSASVSVSVSAAPSPSKSIKRTEGVDVGDVDSTTTTTKDDGDDRMANDAAVEEQHAQDVQVEKSAKDLEQEKKDSQIPNGAGDGSPVTKVSESKTTSPSPREKSISGETDVHVNTMKPEQGEFFSFLFLPFLPSPPSSCQAVGAREQRYEHCLSLPRILGRQPAGL